jgi:hypothetical protein
MYFGEREFGVIGLGVFFALISIFMLWRAGKLKKACTAQTCGTILSCARRITRGRKGKRSTSYESTFKYSVNGVEYLKSVKRRYAEGQQVTVHYDPSNPNRHYADKTDSGWMFFLGIGAFLIILPVLVKLL